jgi:pilus assembly protein Flp/PilA
MKNLVARFVKDESGATAIEYGLIAALISIAIVGTLPFVGSQLVTTFNKIKDALVTANAPAA